MPLLLSGNSTARLELPPSLMDQAGVVGGPSARMLGDELPDNKADRVKKLREQSGSPDGYNVCQDPPTSPSRVGAGR